MTNLPVLNGTINHLNGKEKKKPGLSQYRITAESLIPPITPVITIREKIYAIQGDIAGITGQSKAGKSTICQLLIATALLENIPTHLDTLHIRTTYCNGRPVGYIDTEQPEQFTDKFRQRIEKLVGRTEIDNLHVYNIRELSAKDRRERIFEEFEILSDAHLWIVDGIADLVSDPNQTDESNELIGRFMRIAKRLKTTILLCLHENPGTGTQKMRGNLGSELERKCGGTIVVKKDKETYTHRIESKVLRADSDFEPVEYRYDQASGQLRTLNNIEQQQIQEDKQNKLQRVANQCFLGGLDYLNYNELVRRIQRYYKPGAIISDRPAKEAIKQMTKDQIIYKNEEGKYGLCKEKIQEKRQNFDKI